MKNKDTISNDDLLYSTKDKPSENTSVLYQSIHENSFRSLKATKYNARQGQGFAAEDGNNLIDRFKFRDAKVIGNDNKKNGPDRISDGQLIQTKYCRTAADSVSAAFRHGEYRYIDSNGMPMQLEVPKDQYEEALKYMRQRIAKGEVPGITAPDQADKIIRQGNIDYQTACRIAKAGNIDSLLYDAANGSIIASSVFGISGIISFAQCLWSGKKINEAIDIAIYNGIKSGGYAFICSIATAQLTRTSLNNVLLKPSIKIAKLLPSKVRKLLAQSLKNGSITCSEEVTRDLAKLLRGNLIAAGVTMIALSAEDITNAFRGRISAKQLFKNITTLFAGLSGGYTGAAAGGAIGAPLGPAGITAGSIVGGIIGATAIGQGTNILISKIVEDDVDFMLRILNDELIKLNDEYLLTKEETDIIIDELHLALTPETMFKMFESSNRNEYARNILIEIIEQLIRWRSKIIINPEFIATTTKEFNLNSNIYRKQFLPSTNTSEYIASPAEKKGLYIKRQNAITCTQIQSILLLAKQDNTLTWSDINMNRALESIINDKSFLEIKFEEFQQYMQCEDIVDLFYESTKINYAAKEEIHKLSAQNIINRFIGFITGSNQEAQMLINKNIVKVNEIEMIMINKILELKRIDSCIYGMMFTLEKQTKDMFLRMISIVNSNDDFRELEASVKHNILHKNNPYSKMSDITKFIKLAMHIYKKAGGLHTENHVSILWRVMEDIELPPTGKVNFYRTIRDLFNNKTLLKELIGDSDILTNNSETDSRIIMVLRKMYALEHEEKYIIDSIAQGIEGITSSDCINDIEDNIIINYFSKLGYVIDTDIDNLNFFYRLLYTIKAIHAMSDYEQSKKLNAAEKLFRRNKIKEAVPALEELANIGNTKAMYLLGEIYYNQLPPDENQHQKANFWLNRGMDSGDILCQYKCTLINNKYQYNHIPEDIYNKLDSLAKTGDIYAQYELGNFYFNRNDFDNAIKYSQNPANNGFAPALHMIGHIYARTNCPDIACSYYMKAGKNGYDWGWYSLGLYLENLNYRHAAITCYNNAIELNMLAKEIANAQLVECRKKISGYNCFYP